MPDHSKKPGDYSRGHALPVDKFENANGKGSDDGERRAGDMILPEEEVFDDMSPEEVAHIPATGKEVDAEMNSQELAQMPAKTNEVDAEINSQELAQMPAKEHEVDAETSPGEVVQAPAPKKEGDIETGDSRGSVESNA